MEFDKTMHFEVEKIENLRTKEILKEVYEALQEKGYNPINQLVGYILSGDPTYITSYHDARNKIRTIERDELLEKMVKNYIGIEKSFYMEQKIRQNYQLPCTLNLPYCNCVP